MNEPTTEAGRGWVSAENADLRHGDPDRARKIALAIEAEARADLAARLRKYVRHLDFCAYDIVQRKSCICGLATIEETGA